jgi:hypothetical protein
LSDVFVDKSDEKIEPINIENIEKSIVLFLEKIQKIQNTFSYIQKKINIKKDKEFYNIINDEKIWII